LRLNPGAQTAGGSTRFAGFQLGVQFRGDIEELAIARLPNLEKRAGIETTGDRTALIQLRFKSLADQVLLETLTAGVFEDTRKPEELLAIEAGERCFGSKHEL
jgi:hypothetical protein